MRTPDWKYRLQEHESELHPKIWQQIESEMWPDKPRRMVPLFWWALGSLALLVGLITRLLTLSPDPARPITSKLESLSHSISSSPSQNTMATSTANGIPRADTKQKSNPAISNETDDHVEFIVDSKDPKRFQPSFVGKPTPKQTVEIEEEIGILESSNLPLQDRTNNESLVAQGLPPSFEETKPLSAMPFKSIKSSTESFTPLTKEDPCTGPDPKIGCPQFDKRSGSGLSRWALDVTYGPGYPLRTIAASSPESEPWAMLRNRDEQARFDELAQIRVSYISQYGIAVRSGLQYRHVVDRLQFDRDSVIGSVTTITIDTTFNGDGSFTLSRDTVTTPRLGRVSKTAHNHYRLLQIPIILGYEWKRADWTLHVNGGAIANILLARDGEILDATDSPIPIRANPLFKDRWDLSLFTSLGIHYRLLDNWHLLVEPSATIPLGSILQNDAAIRQQYLSLNVNIGIRFEF